MDPSSRYARQIALEQIGAAGQQRLAQARVLLVGCGALGCTQADLLARAGVGTLRIVDRDLVELTNLHRQTLFDEEDAEALRPKAEAAARRLRRVNSTVTIEPLVLDVNARNVEALVRQADVVLDATDNVETRFTVNDACVKLGRPFVYGGAVGTSGLLLTVVPGRGPCLRCVFPEPPPPGSLPTCDVAGVLNSVSTLVGALQVAEAIKLLTGSETPPPGLLAVDVWAGTFRPLRAERDPDCPCCVRRRFEMLEASSGSLATSLCGRQAVQLTPAADANIDLEQLAARLRGAGEVQRLDSLVRFRTGAHELLVFADGRTIVKGTADVSLARSLHARFVGC